MQRGRRHRSWTPALRVQSPYNVNCETTKQRSLRLFHIAVHLAVLIVEDAQIRNLVDQILDIRLRVSN